MLGSFNGRRAAPLSPRVRTGPPAPALAGLTKRYDDGLLALDAVDLEISDGDFFGSLGPNGAGEEIAVIRGGSIFARDSADALSESYAADSLADVYVKAMSEPLAAG